MAKTLNSAEKAAYLKKYISMPDVIAMYHKPGRNRRTTCPIHGGTHDNLGYDEKLFHCFTCGAKGDIISFVMQLFDCNVNAAVDRLAYDFGIKLDNLTNEEKAAIDAERIAHEEARLLKARRERANLQAYKLIGRFRRWLGEYALQHYDPKKVELQKAWCDRQLGLIEDGGDFGGDVKAAIRSFVGVLHG